MDPEKKTDDTTDTNDFDDAFAAASKDDEPAQETPEEATDETPPSEEAAGEDEDGGETGAEDTPGEEEPSDPPAAKDDAPEDNPPPAKEEQPETTLTNDQLLARMSELLGKAGNKDEPPKQEQQEPPKQEQPKGGEQEQPERPPLYTEEEKQFLESYRNDWPDIAKAEALQRRAEYAQLVDFVFAQVREAINPLNETVETLATRTHLEELQTKVEDYDDVRDKVVEWVQAQPAYLRAAYEHVITQGTVEEVADLVDRYRKENGVEPKPAAEAATQQQPRDTELPAATKKAAAGLAPVRSKRSQPSATADPADFDAAFAAFAAKI